MNFFEAIRISLSSLRANKLRSGLTLLGIVIGVMTVITVVSFIAGLNTYVEERIFTLGADVFTITRQPNVIMTVEDWMDAQRRRNLFRPDGDAVRAACRDCKLVGVGVNSGARVKFGREYLTDTQIRGWSFEVQEIMALDIVQGRAITDYEESHSRRVCVVGADVAERLFPFVDPIGKTLSINDEPFEIIGLTKKEGTVLGQSRDNYAVIPITVHEKMWGFRRSVAIYGKAYGEDRIDAAADQARLALRSRRHVPANAKDDFTISTNAGLLAIWGNISRTFFAVTIGIASISLVVGGIVVMNIMLVSVTERTREIGIRKATGATKRDILIQFLVESATLALAGGIIGVSLGIGIAVSVSEFTPLPAAIRWWAITLGLFVSTAVGLFFGIYPARKAANLDPIAALRYE